MLKKAFDRDMKSESGFSLAMDSQPFQNRLMRKYSKAKMIVVHNSKHFDVNECVCVTKFD